MDISTIPHTHTTHTLIPRTLSYHAHSHTSYCTKAKDLFTSLNLPFHHLDLDLLPNGADIQAELAEFSGQRTVPNIFIKGKHVGGCDKVHQLHAEGKLLSML